MMAMRGSNSLVHQAWDSLGNGALFTKRIPARLAPAQNVNPAPTPFFQVRCAHKYSFSQCRNQPLFAPPRIRSQCAALGFVPQASTPSATIRGLQSSTTKREAATAAQTTSGTSQKADSKKSSDPFDEEVEEDESQTFKLSERAAKASQINLSAKLSSRDAKDKTSGGWREIVRLLKIARPEVKTLGVAFIFLLISSGVSMTLPFSIGKILDAATQEEGTLFGLQMDQFYIALGSVLAIGACANYGRIILLRIVGERIVTKLRSKLFQRTFVQNAEFFDANRVGDLISRLGSDTIIVGKSITQNVSDGLRSLVSAVAGFTLMGYVSLKLTGILAIAFPPVAIGAFLYGRAIRNLSRKIQKNLGTLTKIAEERLGNVRTSQAFAGELQEVHRYNTQTRKVFDLGKTEAFISATFFSATGFMGNMTFLAVLYVGGGMVRSGAISVGDLTTFMMYTAYAGSSLFGLSSFYSELMKGVGAASRLFELQDRDPSISPTRGEPVKSARGVIEFKNVAFSYPTRPAVQIFTDLTFTIPQGRNVAIVAPSGAGKSTVASILLRFYDPTSGTITINGKNISEMNAKQLRRKIGYVGQEPVLFSGTIAENIAYGRPRATKSEIVAAARQANCQFISDFPDGLDTFVGARGTQLSGGQKQRIAIARALLKNPDILILDEATSALDAESETLVNQALQTLLQGSNTTISIAHRLSTIQRSDTIVCLGPGGSVAQVGTYAELSADKEGAFAKLMEWQINGGQPNPVPAKDADEHELTEEERLAKKLEEHGEEDSRDEAATTEPATAKRD